MAVDVLLGLQWGDEGKGKIVDNFTPQYDIVARFQGGPNAGHTIEFSGQKHVLHLIPSGIFHEGCQCLIGGGVVIDPVILVREIEQLIAAGVNVREKLRIARRANIILPTHKLLDAASEAANRATLHQRRDAFAQAEREKARAEAAKAQAEAAKTQAEANKILAEAEYIRTEANARRQQAQIEAKLRFLEAVSRLRQEGGELYVDSENLEQLLRQLANPPRLEEDD